MRTAAPKFLRRSSVRALALILGVVLLGLGGLRTRPADATGACGAKVLFVVDRSSSIGVDQFAGGNANAVANVAAMRAGITEFGKALAGPDSAMDVFAFATTATRLGRPGQGNAWVPMRDEREATFYAATVANLAFKQGATPSAQDAYPGAPLRWFDGTVVWEEQQPDPFPASSEGLTNWDDALRLATLVGSWHAFNDSAPTHVVFLTDGSPTTNTAEREAAARAGYSFSAAGLPNAHEADADDLAPAVAQAQAIRNAGIKIVPVGIGQVNRANLQALAGDGNPTFYTNSFAGVTEQLKAAASNICEDAKPQSTVNVAAYAKGATGEFTSIALEGLTWSTGGAATNFATQAGTWVTPIAQNTAFDLTLTAPRAPSGLQPTAGPRGSQYDCFVGNPDVGTSAVPVNLTSVASTGSLAFKTESPVQPGSNLFCRFFYEGAPKTGTIEVSTTNTVKDLNAATEASFPKAGGWDFEVRGTGIDFRATTTAGQSLNTPFSATGTTDITIARTPIRGWSKADTPRCTIDGAAVPAAGFTETLDSIVLKSVAAGSAVVCEFVEVATKGIDLVKSEKNSTTEASKGDQLTYEFAVKNTGTLTLNNVVVSDPLLGGELGVINTLAAGASASVPSVNYTVPETAGAQITNTATATGTTTDGKGTEYGEVSATDEYTVTIATHPTIALLKTAVEANSDTEIKSVSPGEAYRYRFDVTNAGDVNLANVILTDESLGLTGSKALAIGALKVGETKSVYSPYTLDAADERDVIDNTAKVCAGTVCAEDSTSVAVNRTTAWDITKSVDQTVVRDGEKVTWTVTVTNTGNKPITNLEIKDEQFPDAWDPVDIGVGKSVTRTVSKTLTAADFDADGTFENVACATVGEVSECSPAVVVYLAKVKLTKVATPTTVRPGDTVTYTFTVENVGGTSLTRVVITDPALAKLLGQNEVKLDLPGVLEPGATAKAVTLEVKIPADYSEKTFVNTAAVSAIPIDPATDEPAPDRSVTATATAKVKIVRPGITVTKTANAPVVKVGDVVEYTITVKNTGDLDLTDISVVDEMLAIDDTIDALAMGESTTITRKWIVPSDAAGTVSNVVTVCVDAEDLCRDDQVDVEVVNITIVKSTDVDSTWPGDEVEYTFTVTNHSDIMLTDLEVTDDVLGSIGVIDALDAGASTTLTQTFTVSDDATAPIVNTATVCVVVPDEAPATVLTTDGIVAVPATSDRGDLKKPNLKKPDVKKPEPPTESCADACPSNATPGDNLIEPTDAAPARAASAVSEAPRVLCATDTHTLPVGKSSITLTKGADRDNAIAGETITYTYTVTNTGTGDLTELALVDDKLGEIDLKITALAPGESATAVATYTVVATDTATIKNVAVVTALTPNGAKVTAEAHEEVGIVTVAPARVDPQPPPTAAPQGQLPHTGSGTNRLVTFGLILLGLGLVAVAAGRFRIPAFARRR